MGRAQHLRCRRAYSLTGRRTPNLRIGLAPDSRCITHVNELEHVFVIDEVAWKRCRDALYVIPNTGGACGGGDAVHLASDRLTIDRKQRDGRWLLACGSGVASRAESVAFASVGDDDFANACARR